MSAEMQQGRAMRPSKGAEYLGIGLSTFWRYARTLPDFPRPVKVSPRVTLFMEDELSAWLEKRAAERQAA
ncbi:helix-turn-helix transcriptional regulator [Robbsia andropogonis]|uniref:helix-turn-helix transcriptional regulator n=1 Tax=Robbsia andropogonis TaxID=28092 RepID=UPI002A6B0CFD|nr:AlpA family phage regulatory protein [Robbsia andropogonis]